jgi:hypothetical protein
MTDADGPHTCESALSSPGLEVGDEGAGNASRSCFIAHLEWRVRLLEATAPGPGALLTRLRFPGRWRETAPPTGQDARER